LQIEGKTQQICRSPYRSPFGPRGAVAPKPRKNVCFSRSPKGSGLGTKGAVLQIDGKTLQIAAPLTAPHLALKSNSNQNSQGEHERKRPIWAVVSEKRIGKSITKNTTFRWLVNCLLSQFTCKSTDLQVDGLARQFRSLCAQTAPLKGAAETIFTGFWQHRSLCARRGAVKGAANLPCFSLDWADRSLCVAKSYIMRYLVFLYMISPPQGSGSRSLDRSPSGTKGAVAPKPRKNVCFSRSLQGSGWAQRERLAQRERFAPNPVKMCVSAAPLRGAVGHKGSGFANRGTNTANLPLP